MLYTPISSYIIYILPFLVWASQADFEFYQKRNGYAFPLQFMAKFLLTLFCALSF